MAFRPHRRSFDRKPIKRHVKRRSYFAAVQPEYIDYKDLNTIARYVTQFSRIQPRRYTGNSVKHQKMVTQAIKRARYMALLPYTMEHASYKQE